MDSILFDKNNEAIQKKIIRASIAINLNFDDYNSYCRRASLYESVNLFKLALDDAVKAISIDNKKDDAYLFKAKALIGLKKYSESEKCLIECLEVTKSKNNQILNQLENLRYLAVKNIGFEDEICRSASKRFQTINDAVNGAFTIVDLNDSNIREEENNSNSILNYNNNNMNSNLVINNNLSTNMTDNNLISISSSSNNLIHNNTIHNSIVNTSSSSNNNNHLINNILNNNNNLVDMNHQNMNLQSNNSLIYSNSNLISLNSINNNDKIVYTCANNLLTNFTSQQSLNESINQQSTMINNLQLENSNNTNLINNSIQNSQLNNSQNLIQQQQQSHLQNQQVQQQQQDNQQVYENPSSTMIDNTPSSEMDINSDYYSSDLQIRSTESEDPLMSSDNGIMNSLILQNNINNRHPIPYTPFKEAVTDFENDFFLSSPFTNTNSNSSLSFIQDSLYTPKLIRKDNLDNGHLAKKQKVTKNLMNDLLSNNSETSPLYENSPYSSPPKYNLESSPFSNTTTIPSTPKSNVIVSPIKTPLKLVNNLNDLNDLDEYDNLNLKNNHINKTNHDQSDDQLDQADQTITNNSVNNKKEEKENTDNKNDKQINNDLINRKDNSLIICDNKNKLTPLKLKDQIASSLGVIISNSTVTTSKKIQQQSCNRVINISSLGNILQQNNNLSLVNSKAIITKTSSSKITEKPNITYITFPNNKTKDNQPININNFFKEKQIIIKDDKNNLINRHYSVPQSSPIVLPPAIINQTNRNSVNSVRYRKNAMNRQSISQKIAESNEKSKSYKTDYENKKD